MRVWSSATWRAQSRLDSLAQQGTRPHLRIEPDRQRASALGPFVIGRPDLGPVDRGDVLPMQPSYHAGFMR